MNLSFLCCSVKAKRLDKPRSIISLHKVPAKHFFMSVFLSSTTSHLSYGGIYESPKDMPMLS